MVAYLSVPGMSWEDSLSVRNLPLFVIGGYIINLSLGLLSLILYRIAQVGGGMYVAKKLRRFFSYIRLKHVGLCMHISNKTYCGTLESPFNGEHET